MPDDNNNGNPPPPDEDAILASLPPEVREVIDRRVAKTRDSAWAEARRTLKPKDRPAEQAATGGNSAGTLEALVQLKVAELIGAMKPAAPSTPPPVMPGGTPPARVVPEDMPILSMSEADKSALAKRIGPWKFRERLFSELRSQNVRVGRRS